MIEVNHLTKKFGDFYSIQNVHLQIPKGEVFGFLGPNGAGKSTTIRHLMGFLQPTEGSCFINGLNCREASATIQQVVGYLPGEIAFIDKMTGKQFIHFIAKLRGMNDYTHAEELMHFFELDASGLIKKMSKGMKQKVGLVCAFMHHPEIVILDEPTSGLDPLMQTKFIEFILAEKDKGTTIFMSSHMIEEVEKTCDRVAIINAGKIVATETITDLKKRKSKKYMLEFQDEQELTRFLDEEYVLERISSTKVMITIMGDLQAFLHTLSNYKIIDLDVISQSLEDIFMHYYESGGA
ncbi:MULTISPECIES: ABC transporter ATP-binding protein [Lysinibacillus]|uniref:ABC transporter n=2 Tax=Lysinibacillus TaxID=400634 RepID=A0A2X0XM00_9BACI|nr:ABC transporter ATP-binding protein [Lysinibacillus capsici]MCR6523802.1 ABC transporter ATP-binding protein [Lysinibacillus capsici]MCT1539855.1 ABC transporter ATP-binding protein [Lysinibacillus capsici]MCT1570925.1 ABC transporter ATP-binding protein [Lysinibacillus capsici]MCT1648328.1 ABC transporter ATP-binding protein [Lysinibacillus capsici]MCT1726870.1 ABC transporter ATP-binding protein [Lysinibacillus capsici]